jgi:hypothetical protein
MASDSALIRTLLSEETSNPLDHVSLPAPLLCHLALLSIMSLIASSQEFDWEVQHKPRISNTPQSKSRDDVYVH